MTAAPAGGPMVKPLVVYQCVVNGCGLRLVGIVAEHGRPRVGFWLANMPPEMARPGGGTSWFVGAFLDTPRESAKYAARVLAKNLPEELEAYLLEKLKAKQAEMDVWLVSCRNRNHGPWEIPTTAMLEHWNQARRSNSLPPVKLDNASPWKA